MAWYDEMFRLGGRYDRDFERPRHRAGGFRSGYGREYRGYAQDFDRLRSDAGDPFGDRARRTPIRMIPGAFRDYADEFRGRARPFAGYGREFRPRPRRPGFGPGPERGFGPRPERGFGYGSQFRGAPPRGYGREYGRGWW
ncbi:MAG TPA: hypothetical protein VFQ38_05690 [Longimicrobiales bacterium]|nr:hypothetical protein [Longimicrobiales bacterium]